MSGHRFAVAPAVFADLAGRAARCERVTYGTFAGALGLGAPIGLSWILMPLLLWCEARGLPPLPILVVRSRDGRPSGPYDEARIPADTDRVFGHAWDREVPPTPDELAEVVSRRR